MHGCIKKEEMGKSSITNYVYKQIIKSYKVTKKMKNRENERKKEKTKEI